MATERPTQDGARYVQTPVQQSPRAPRVTGPIPNGRSIDRPARAQRGARRVQGVWRAARAGTNGWRPYGRRSPASPLAAAAAIAVTVSPQSLAGDSRYRHPSGRRSGCSGRILVLAGELELGEVWPCPGAFIVGAHWQDVVADASPGVAAGERRLALAGIAQKQAGPILDQHAARVQAKDIPARQQQDQAGTQGDLGHQLGIFGGGAQLVRRPDVANRSATRLPPGCAGEAAGPDASTGPRAGDCRSRPVPAGSNHRPVQRRWLAAAWHRRHVDPPRIEGRKRLVGTDAMPGNAVTGGRRLGGAPQAQPKGHAWPCANWSSSGCSPLSACRQSSKAAQYQTSSFSFSLGSRASSARISQP